MQTVIVFQCKTFLKKKNVATVLEVEILFVKDEYTLLKEYSARDQQGGKGRCLQVSRGSEILYESTNGQRLFFPEDQHQKGAVCRAHRTNSLNKDAAMVGKEPPWERNQQGNPSALARKKKKKLV